MCYSFYYFVYRHLSVFVAFQYWIEQEQFYWSQRRSEVFADEQTKQNEEVMESSSGFLLVPSDYEELIF